MYNSYKQADEGERKWCSTTFNYNADEKWGYCKRKLEQQDSQNG